MLIIGLTGATGSGKSEFARVASERFGVYHINTDNLARKVTQKGEVCLAELANAFGNAILDDDGNLVREKLASVAFAGEEQHSTLNRITHHYIGKEVEKILHEQQSKDAKAVIIDAPLLFESGEDALCHVTVGVVADERIRLKRIMSRDGISEKRARERMNAGKDDAFFVERCDVMITNNFADIADYEKCCENVLTALLSQTKGDIHA